MNREFDIYRLVNDKVMTQKDVVSAHDVRDLLVAQEAIYEKEIESLSRVVDAMGQAFIGADAVDNCFNEIMKDESEQECDEECISNVQHFNDCLSVDDISKLHTEQRVADEKTRKSEPSKRKIDMPDMGEVSFFINGQHMSVEDLFSEPLSEAVAEEAEKKNSRCMDGVTDTKKEHLALCVGSAYGLVCGRREHCQRYEGGIQSFDYENIVPRECMHEYTGGKEFNMFKTRLTNGTD